MSRKIRQELKSATGELRGELTEGAGFFQDLRNGTLPLDGYVRLLRTLTALYTVLPGKKGNRGPGRGGLSFRSLQEDLFFFRYRLIGDRKDAVEESLKFVAAMRSRIDEDASVAGGYAYALEVFREDLAELIGEYGKKWGLEAGGGFFFLTESSDLREESTVLNGVESGGSSGELEGLVRTATDTFEFLKKLVDLLYPVEAEEEVFSSFTLNPASGDYPACGDREILRGVLHASDRALAENPYYVRRYGMSAFFFTDSDGAWLTTLTETGFEAMKEQILWLAGVLTSRGIPTFLIARHLLILREELMCIRPDLAGQWILLERVSDGLDPSLSDTVEGRVAVEIPGLHRGAGFPDSYESREAAEIITRVMLEERRGSGTFGRGSPGAAQSVISWYTDPERFPESWIMAVERLVEKAGELVDSLFSRR